ncbi:MAG: class I SAM-dependent methyltransferase, partial [Bacteroidaceae bacterium]|nr:class I SAM-dependent methyltransferase [Bacteroidaceae bacterium]
SLMEPFNNQGRKPTLVVMLTKDDFTVMNAAEIFEQCKDTPAQCWGFKEHPLPLLQMKELYARMKACGKKTFMEVVVYSEAEGLEGAKMAAECGCDILMGTRYHDSINEFCKQHNLKYMPFVGQIEGRPSVLSGSVDDMIAEARQYLEKGVYGIDLLAYRYTGNPVELSRAFLREIKAPVCMAGSIQSFEQLDEVKQLNPWAFTIGSAFFEKKFGDTFPEQICKVCDYMECPNEVVDYYDTIAEDYDNSRFNNSYGRFIDAQERKLLDRLIDTASSTLRLDMACGTGRLTNYATHGLDASNEMMKLAKKRHPSVEFRQASAAETGFPDNTFDLVYSFHLLMHLDMPTVQAIFSEVHRILKPGGRFIFDIPSKKRRQLLRHKQASWHGRTELSTEDLSALIAGRYALRSRHGIMMLPVHKLPVGIRKPLQKIDFLLANGWLKEYSSYLLFELVKLS